MGELDLGNMYTRNNEDELSRSDTKSLGFYSSIMMHT